jgi:TonB family protein
MQCPRCQRVNSVDYRFCLNCGTDLIQQTIQAYPGLTQKESRPQPSLLDKKSGSMWLLVVIVTAFATIAVLAWKLINQPRIEVDQTRVSGGEVQTPISPSPEPSEPRSQPSLARETALPKVEPGQRATAERSTGTAVGESAPLPITNASPPIIDYNRIFTGSEVTSKARLISKPEPQYTEEARKNQITGTVVLKVVFSSSGQVTNIRTVSGLPYGLTERAIAAAAQIKFTPATKDGHEVSMWMQLEYNFNLY